ncbi:MAG TPA: MarR family winged helix-turn-helix transcriptional regulator [Actinomycetaceae bacterium]|nr:MarR family winged helix-turn-helix transcriptional regulator [Actinomycetaceae bacterium]
MTTYVDHEPLAEDIVTEPLPNALDPNNFTPRLLALLSNALVRQESSRMRQQFGLGTNDWRVISALATRPGSSATEVSEFLSLNKALISGSVSGLVERHLIVLRDGPRGSRPMYLTRAGAKIHDEMLPLSLRGQDVILEGLTPDVVKGLNLLLQDMHKRLNAAAND